MELFKFEYFVKKCSKFEGNPSKTRKIVQTLENSENGTFPKVCWVFRDKMELSIKWNFWSNFSSFKTQNGTPFYREIPVRGSQRARRNQTPAFFKNIPEFITRQLPASGRRESLWEKSSKKFPKSVQKVVQSRKIEDTVQKPSFWPLFSGFFKSCWQTDRHTWTF